MTESSKDRFDRESTEENTRLSRKSVRIMLWTLGLTAVALIVALWEIIS